MNGPTPARYRDVNNDRRSMVLAITASVENADNPMKGRPEESNIVAIKNDYAPYHLHIANEYDHRNRREGSW
jgi:hypothetical protein